MPTVWIPSLPHRYDAATDSMVPAYDVNGAGKFGELSVIVDGPILSMPSAIAQVRRAPIAPGDYIMAIGDVVLIAVAIAGVFGDINILRWNKRSQDYEVVNV